LISGAPPVVLRRLQQLDAKHQVAELIEFGISGQEFCSHFPIYPAVL